MGRLEEKVAIVTGSSRGIGAAVARRLAAEGAKVVVNYTQNKQAAEQVVASIKDQGGEAFSLQADVADEAQMERLFSEASRQFGRVNILVNNAAALKWSPLAKIEQAEFQHLANVNIWGIILGCRMAERHLADAGRIINFSSVTVHKPQAWSGMYAATKAAVESLTRTAAVEFAPRNITVNALVIGLVATDMVSEVPKEALRTIASQTLVGRKVGQPEDVTGSVVFLASEDAQWVTGQTLGVNGGYLMR